jgi:predicted Na+-dependent transporter
VAMHSSVSASAQSSLVPCLIAVADAVAARGGDVEMGKAPVTRPAGRVVLLPVAVGQAAREFFSAMTLRGPRIYKLSSSVSTSLDTWTSPALRFQF